MVAISRPKVPLKWLPDVLPSNHIHRFSWWAGSEYFKPLEVAIELNGRCTNSASIRILLVQAAFSSLNTGNILTEHFFALSAMNFIFLAEGITLSIVPILTLIEHRSEHIVGCVLIGQGRDGELPNWFVNSTLAENPAAELLEHVDAGEVLMPMDVFLVVKEPNSFLQLSVLAAVGCCNLNFSGTGGRGGRTVLKYLAKHNVRTYPAEVKRPSEELSDSQEEMKAAFMYGFNIVAREWLPECWGLDAVRY